MIVVLQANGSVGVTTTGLVKTSEVSPLPSGCCCGEDPECPCCTNAQPDAYRITVTGVADDGCGACSNWNASFDVPRSIQADGCYDYSLDLSGADPAICGSAPVIDISIECDEYTLMRVIFRSGEASSFAQAEFVYPADNIQEPQDCQATIEVSGFFQVGTMDGCNFNGASVTIEAL